MLAFDCALSLAPLLVLLATLAGWIVGADIACSYLGEQLTSLFGSAPAKVLIAATQHAHSDHGIIAAAISVVTLFIGATNVFSALDDALELI